MWVYLPPSPSANRFLSLCEVEVLQKKTWVWRRLSGLTNVALGKPAFASSIYFNGAWAGAPELATDGVAGTTFPFFSHTVEFDPKCDNIFLTVDLLDTFEPSTLTVTTRLDCCAERRTRWEAYLGSSRDWRYNNRLWGPLDVTPVSGNNRVFNIANLKVRGRYLSIRRAPFDPTNCNNAPAGVGTNDDRNVLQVSELELQAPRLLDQPSARSGMGFALYRGSMVIFGGNDASGFRLNDVRFFRLDTQKWMPPALPLGSPPQARAFALLLPLPSNTSIGVPDWTPSSQLALTGGSNNIGDGIGDFSILNFAPCLPVPRAAAPNGNHGIQSEACNAAGTVCSYTCGTGFLPTNGATNTLVCSPDGNWIGNVPVCIPAGGPPQPPSVNAIIAGNTSATVSWSPPSGSTWPITGYRVTVRPTDWIESFAGNSFIDPTAWSIAPSDQPVSHRWSFKSGELLLDGSEGASCDGNNPYNCLSFIRNWPAESGIDPAGSWAIETYLRMDTDSSRQGQNNQNIGLCIYDPANYRGFTGQQLGSCEFYGGVRKTGGRWQYGWEGLFGASPFNTWFDAENPRAYVRLERNADAGTWRILFKFRPGDEWIPNPRVALDENLVNRTVDAANLKIGLVARTWSGTARCLGIFSYIRVMPLGSCAQPGAVRLLNTSQGLSTVITGLSPSAQYRFNVEAATAAGARTLYSNPATSVSVITTPPAVRENWVTWPVNITDLIVRRRLVEVLQGKVNGISMPSTWNNNWQQHGGPALLNGDINDYFQAGYNNIIAPDGDWACMDLGAVTSVKAIYIVNRQNCCQNRVQTLEWYIGNNGPRDSAGNLLRSPWRTNVACDMSLYPNLMSNYPVLDPSLGFPAPYSNYFQCTLTGRYVYFRAPQSLNQLNVNDGQYNVAELRIYASNSCPPRNGTGTVVVTPATCAAGGYGSVCVHTCKPGFVAVSGNGVSTCGGDVWDQPQLVCTAVCPDLAPPAYKDDCLQALYSESFTFPAAASKWASLETNTQNFGQKWFVNDGVLVANARTGCYDQLNAVVAVNTIKEWRSGFTFSARVSSADRAGLIFKATDKLNMYRFSLDFQSATSTHKLERIINGDATDIIDFTMPVTRNRWYTVAVSMAGNQINITVDGVLMVSTRDGVFATGFVGVYSSTSAMFDDVSFTIACMQCQNAQDGETCTYSCQDGLIANGPLSRTCFSNDTASAGLWLPDPVTTPLSCTLPPPTFIPSVLSIRENSPKNAPVGDPLLGSSPAADYQLSWVILSETPFDPSVGNLFYVDSCSGQVKLRQPGIDYERVKNYTLSVRAFILGFDTARTDQLIRVDVIDVDEAPIIRDSTVFLPENSPNGTVFSAPAWSDPEGSVVTWVLDVDSSGGAFSMNAVTGNLTVSGRLPERLNYELFGSSPYELQVTATQVNNPLLFGSGKVYVQLTDANDPPVLQAGLVLRIGQSAFAAAAPVGQLNSTDEDVGIFAAMPIYQLVSPSVVAAGNVPGCARPTGTVSWPTLDMSSSGTALFTAQPFSGVVNVASATAPNWAQMTPFLSFGSLARATYALCVNVSDGRAWTTGTATVVVMADVGSAALISDMMTPMNGVSTMGGDAVSFTGTGFTSGTLTSSFYTNGLVSYNASCNVTSPTTINCTTVAGAGANLEWRFTINGAGVMAAKDLIMSYRPPVVTSMVYTSNVPTDGNSSGVALIYGQLGTFGPPGTVVQFTYGNSYEYSCAQQVAPDQATVHRCVMAPGVGRDLPWRLSMGGQITDSTAYGGTMLVSYAPPNITRISPTCAPGPCVPRFGLGNLSTAGGELLKVEGTNFGPNSRLPDFTVTFGGPTGSLVSMSCVRSAGSLAHRELTCTTPPGSGRSHAVALTVGGQVALTGPFVVNRLTGYRTAPANNTGLAYAPPVVTRVYGQGALGGGTDGGEVLNIDGTNLGPLSGLNALAVIDFVRYGHRGDENRYTATDCRVISVPGDGSGSSTMSTISCLTAEGVGSGHWLVVSINGQVSNVYQANISYSPPQIASYSGPGALNGDTVGGDAVVISGEHNSNCYSSRHQLTFSSSCACFLSTSLTPHDSDAFFRMPSSSFSAGMNFGPGEANSNYATYFQPLMRVSYGGRLNGGPFTVLTFNASACRVTKPHTEVSCFTAEGAGKGQTYTMVLDGLRSVVPTTNYAPPQVLQLALRTPAGAPTATASVGGGTILIVQGRFFGPPDHQRSNRTLIQSITYGPSGSEELIPSSLWSHINHTAIRVTLPPGFGSALRVIVTVADQVSAASTATFSYATPSIAWVAPNLAGTYSNPRAPTTITLGCRNLPVTDTEARFTVLFGSASAPLPILPTYPTTAAGIAAATNPDGTLNVTFLLPSAGAGVQLGVRLQLTRIGTSFSFTTVNQLFSYRPPTVAAILVSNARFLPANTTRPNATDAVPCPYGGAAGSDGFVAVCGSLRFRIEIQGNDFSLFDTDLPGSKGMDWSDAADRSLSVYLNRTGGTWVTASTTNADAYLYSWSHNKIVVFSSQSESSLRVTINSITYAGLTQTQQVQAAFKAVNLEILLPLQGADSPFPTTGSDNELVSARVRGLAGATDIQIYVGPWRVTRIIDPGTNAPFASQAAFIAWATTNVPTDGVWTLRFSVPAGQGRNVPVRIMRVLPDGSTVSSTQAAVLSYLPPQIASVEMLDAATGNTIGPSVIAIPGALVKVPTDGSVRLRIRGNNFGVSPVVLIGDGVRLGLNATLPCPAALGLTNHTCREAPVPEGEGSGRVYAEYPNGFTLDMEAQAGNDDATLITSNDVSFSYDEPEITGLVSLDTEARFPTRGNVTVMITGRNFGRVMPRRSESRIIVEFWRAGSTEVPQQCRNPQRMGHTSLTCTLPEGSGANLYVRLTIADLSNSSSTALFSYNLPVITNVTSTEGEDAIAGYRHPLLRGHTNGTAIVTVFGRDLGARLPGVHCIYLSWIMRRRGSDYVWKCDGEWSGVQWSAAWLCGRHAAT